MRFSKEKAHLIEKWHELCRDRAIRLLNQWHGDAESWLLQATLEEHREAIEKLHEQLGDAAAIGWNRMLKLFGI